VLILIEKDSATRVPKDCSLEDAQALATQFPIHVVNEDGSTTPLADYVRGLEPVTGEAVVIGDPESRERDVVVPDAQGDQTPEA
jgi:hypothetical protein